MFSGQDRLLAELEDIREGGFYKIERTLTTSQGARVRVAGGRPVVNMCANNYLGLADHPDIIAAAHAALDRWGYGLSSVRFICGTQTIHKDLEAMLSAYLGAEDTILYSSCFDANAGLFETLLGDEDAVISDELNHASIIDGIRLCKAQRFRYRHRDLADLDTQLHRAKGARQLLIATDGVFSMDGHSAPLGEMCALAEAHQAWVMVDDSHGVGVVGQRGRGTHEQHDVIGRVDIITGTLGKAFGGASGGYTSGKREIIELLRQRSRPYLFSNSLAPPIVAASLRAIELLTTSSELRERLHRNTALFRRELSSIGFNIVSGDHPIVPIMLGDAGLATQMADRLLDKGVYVIGFSYPVVPREQARIRTQVSAAHTEDDLVFALEQFRAVHRELGI